MTATGVPPAPPVGEAHRRSVLIGAARSGGLRMLILPVSAVLGVVVTRLIVQNYGTAALAQYGLLVAIGMLLPFTDLGVSSAVMTVVGASDSPHTDEHVRRVLITAVRVLIGSALVLSAVAVLITVTGMWHTLLGPGLRPGSGSTVAMSCLLLIALAMPLGVGQRILIGLGKTHVAVAVGGFQTPFVLTVLGLLIWLGVPAGDAVPVIAYLGAFVLSLAGTVWAAHHIKPMLGEVLRGVPKLRTERGGKVLDVAWPTLVVSIALPIAMQTDRIVLSHRSPVATLAEYNLAAQMFLPIWAIANAAGVTLWPVFARARARGVKDSPVPTAGVFGAVAALMAAGIAVCSPWLARVATGGQIQLHLLLVVSFAVLMTLQGLKQPLGTYLTDAAGLRFQALLIVLMLPVNLGLSWYLARPLGAAGPVIGSVVGVTLFQVIPNWIYVRRRLGAPRTAVEFAA